MFFEQNVYTLSDVRCKRSPVELRPEQSLPEATIMRWFFWLPRSEADNIITLEFLFPLKVAYSKITFSSEKSATNKIFASFCFSENYIPKKDEYSVYNFT